MPGARARLWREPLVHFLAIGAALFLGFAWWGGPDAASHRIVITPGQIDTLAAAFERTWQRPPSETELKGQIDEYVKEEIAVREAGTLGLDRDDTVIRRRLRQKLEFLSDDAVADRPPTGDELQAWLNEHRDAYALDARLSLRQVFLSPARYGDALEAVAQSLLRELMRRGGDTPIETLGDRTLLPAEVDGATHTEIARQFGDEFSAALLSADTGRWLGPVRSSYGVHIVFVRTREPGRVPALPEIRPQVERDVFDSRRRQQLQTMYDGLLGRYRVLVEKREPPLVRDAVASTAAAGGGRP